MKFSEIFGLTFHWWKYSKKLSKPLITDEDFENIEQEIANDLHINEPAGKVYKHKNNKYEKK